MNFHATLALANHRPEAIGPCTKLMARHDTIILEEPPDDLFRQMLAGNTTIDDYLKTLDLEYPEFSRRMSEALREFHRTGKNLYQVEPFMEKLIDIHELFANGGGPDDLEAGTEMQRVYAAERHATAALIDFYKISVQGNFEDTIGAVQRFARADAERFRLRDRMRAEAIASIINRPGSYYIEAGQMHYLLGRAIKRRLPPDYPLALTFVMAPVVRRLGRRGHLYGPGDLLTLLYLLHPERNLPQEQLYAARALIYNKLLIKDEMVDATDPFPHTRDEIDTAETVRKLSLEDCRRLFHLIRRASTATARDLVDHYLKHRT